MTPEQLLEESKTYDEGDAIRCPWCGARHTDLSEHGLGDYDTEEVECGSCDRTYTLSCSITVRYTATRAGKDVNKHGHWCLWGNHVVPCSDASCDLVEAPPGMVLGIGRTCAPCAEKREQNDG